MPHNPPLEEDWSSYRKLVIDTLRRLDERTLGFHESLNELHTRVTLLEKLDHADELERIDKELIQLRVDFFQYKTKAEADAAAIAGAKQTNKSWVNWIWAIGSIIMSAIISGYFAGVFS